MSEPLTQFIASHWQALLMRSAEHLAMAGAATLAALLTGVLLSVLTYRKPLLRIPLLSITGLLQTIPGIALLVVMMALLHRIGAFPAIATLFLFALLPIVQNTTVALTGVPVALEEAARGLGMTNGQRLRYVRLPLALPSIVAGLRIAAVQTIGLATLAAFIGAGGLGQFINRGLFLSDTRLILLGAIPAAIIAVIIDQFISLVELSVTPRRSRRARRVAGVVSTLIAILLTAFTLTHILPAYAGDKTTVTVGSKNFTEQLIVAEIVSQQIERHTGLHVARKFGLGGSSVLHQALAQGSVDIAVEYTGTALTAILHRPVPADRTQVLPQLREQYERLFGLTWLAPLGFNNSYGMGVRMHDPQFNEIQTITELARIAPQLQAAFDFEFAERPDGYAGLQKAYGLHFKQVRDMHPDLMYNALTTRQADVISAYTTDGRLQRDGIRILRDDKQFFPPYEAAIIASPALLQKNPELAKALAALSGSIDDNEMRELNAAVDNRQMTVEQAAGTALSRLKDSQ
jgi:osmoprotectant transport system permease protein